MKTIWPFSKYKMALPVYILSKKHSCQGILGPMRSGKSSDLLARLDYYETVYKKKVCLIRKKGMHREGIDNPGVASSRNNSYKRICIDLDSTEEFKDFSYDVYALEEAQFIKGAADLVHKLFFDMEKIVIVACLNGNYNQEPFKSSKEDEPCEMGRLIAMFSHVTFTTASCTLCGNEASYSGLNEDVNRKYLESNKGIMVGDTAYASYCSECVFKYRNNTRSD